MAISAKERRRSEVQAQILKAMAHPIRLSIVHFLAEEERCVCDIVEHVGTSPSNVSKHLSIMKQAGIVSDRKEGPSVFYKSNMPCAVRFFDCIRDIMENHLSQRSAALT